MGRRQPWHPRCPSGTSRARHPAFKVKTNNVKVLGRPRVDSSHGDDIANPCRAGPDKPVPCGTVTLASGTSRVTGFLYKVSACYPETKQTTGRRSLSQARMKSLMLSTLFFKMLTQSLSSIQNEMCL